MNVLLIIGLVIFICSVLWVYVLFVTNTVNAPDVKEEDDYRNYSGDALEYCKKLFNEGNYSEVKRAAQKALAKNYGDIEIRRILAQALMELKEDEMAIMHYEAILSVAPFDISTQELLANYYAENGPISRAIELNEQIFMYDSGNVHAVEALAELYSNAQDYENAAKMYELLVKAELDEERLKKLEYVLADLYVKTQQIEKAYDVYRDIYRTDSENLEILLVLADLAGQIKYWKDCLYYYNKVITIAGDDFEILEKIAQIQTTLEQWSEAADTYSKIISLENNQSKNYIWHQNEYCNVLIKNGLYKEAIDRLKNLLLENPKETSFAFTLADAYAVSGNFEAGIDMYKRLTNELPPEQGDMLMNSISNLMSQWAQDLFDKGDYTQAFDKFFEALKYNEENDDVYYRLGVCNYYVKSFQDALSHFRRAVSIKPDNPLYYFGLGCVYDVMGVIKNSKENFLNALNIDPMFIKARIAYALSLTKEMEYAQSIREFNEVLKYLPDNADTLYNLALTYEMTGDKDSAIENYEKALKSDPTHKEALNNIRLLLGDDYMPPEKEIEEEEISSDNGSTSIDTGSNLPMEQSAEQSDIQPQLDNDEATGGDKAAGANEEFDFGTEDVNSYSSKTNIEGSMFG